jgi:hypothetical protein
MVATGAAVPERVGERIMVDAAAPGRSSACNAPYGSAGNNQWVGRERYALVFRGGCWRDPLQLSGAITRDVSTDQARGDAAMTTPFAAGSYSAPQRDPGSQPTGKELLSACWGLLREDRELLWLPVIGSIAGIIAGMILFAPGYAIGWAAGGGRASWGGWLGGLFALFAATAVSIYFQAALVIGANQRADGGNPTVRGVLGEAWSRKGKILSWAALSTTVGLVIRAIEQRAGIVGAILGFLGGVAWAVASFLVIPVVIGENLGPIAAVSRSAHLVRETWGTSVRTGLRLGVMYVLLVLGSVVLLVFGAAALMAGGVAGAVVGVVLVLLGLAALLAVIVGFVAVSTYARALIYRYATGRPVPGIDPALFAGVFQPRRSRRRFA